MALDFHGGKVKGGNLGGKRVKNRCAAQSLHGLGQRQPPPRIPRSLHLRPSWGKCFKRQTGVTPKTRHPAPGLLKLPVDLSVQASLGMAGLAVHVDKEETEAREAFPALGPSAPCTAHAPSTGQDAAPMWSAALSWGLHPSTARFWPMHGNGVRDRLPCPLLARARHYHLQATGLRKNDQLLTQTECPSS